MARLFRLLPLVCLFLLLACEKQTPAPGLPPAREMGSFRGQHFLRVETHFHGPYSYDACDDHGLTKDGKITEWCLRDYRYGLCHNHVDVAFNTDHLSHIGDYPYSDLLMHQPGDAPVKNKKGETVGNQISCSDGFKVTHAPGFEGPLLALGLERQPAPDLPTLQTIYGGGERKEIEALEKKSDALVGIPHTESRSIEYLRKVKPSFMEIYNVHAQLHPRMRKDFLHLSPFKPLGGFVKYILDPFNSYNADYLFMEFLEYSDVYFKKWNTLLSEGIHVTGTGGLDSHENVLKFKGSDGERLDAHRRMTRFMSNLVLTSSDDLTSVKEAIRAGRVVVAIEGLGTPVGFDFFGDLGAQAAEMGDTIHLKPGQNPVLIFEMPSVHPKFDGMAEALKNPALMPEIYAELHHIDPSGADTVIMKVTTPVLRFYDLKPGHYRMHVWMVPHHLKPFIAKKSLASTPFQWLISNPIRVVGSLL